jgi:hypothetical protein
VGRQVLHATAVALIATFAIALTAAGGQQAAGAGPVVRLSSRMAAPRWAQLERRLLDENVPAAREFFEKYFDGRGYLQCVVRWGANDGADDAFEHFNHWPELHALGASDDILQMYMKGHEGLIRQYSEARTVDVPMGRDGMYVREFAANQDWQHHGEGLQLFNRMALSSPDERAYLARVKRFSAMYMGEDSDAPNYDPKRRIIRSLLNGSKGPMLRQATSLDWVGDPFDASTFTALHGESTYAQFLAHYQEYTDVVGDHFLNLVATTLPSNAYFATGDEKYRRWVVEYVDAWLGRMKQNGGIIPSFVDLDGVVGGKDGKWWMNAYGWGFSPVNPVTNQREDRNRVARALVGFNNALWLTGDLKYVDAWRRQIAAVNSHARTVGGRTEYPTMHGAGGWYGWRATPWNVGAFEVWYWSQKAEDLARAPRSAWLDFLQGRNPSFPETALGADLANIQRRVDALRNDKTTPATRLADNALDLNPVTTAALMQLAQGGWEPGRDGGLLNARLRYFDPARKRAGLPEDVAALISAMSGSSTTLTLVNLSTTASRTVIVQGGAYAEHRIESTETAGSSGKATPVNGTAVTVTLDPGAGGTLILTMKRYSGTPTVKFPWNRK